MAQQTDPAWSRAELADIDNEDIKVRYADKKRPRGSRQKLIKTRIVDGEFLMGNEMEFQEKGQAVEENAKAKAAKARTKAQNNSVVVKGKGKAAVVTGESSRSANRKEKR